MRDARNWHKGPPPSRGWWPASTNRDSDAIRWWDGRRWSKACYKENSLDQVEHRACEWAIEGIFEHLEWQQRPKSWPKRSFT